MFDPETSTPEGISKLILSRAGSYTDQQTGAGYAIAYALLAPHRNPESLLSLLPAFNAVSGQESMALFQAHRHLGDTVNKLRDEIRDLQRRLEDLEAARDN